jgi:DNA-binding MarR family transcriptional regulator
MLAPFHLTVPQVTVLMILAREETALEVSRIASRSGLPPGTVTSVMDRLHLRQLARRREDPTNGHRVSATITNEGREILRVLDHRRMRLFEELVGPYSDQELQQLLDLTYRWITVADRMVNADDDQRGKS